MGQARERTQENGKGNRRMNIKRLQRDLKSKGLYAASIDGIWGDKSENAYQELLSSYTGVTEAANRLCWGVRVTDEFKAKVISISDDLMINPNWLMACMAFESARTFSPSIKNQAGSGATGLIQFMPSTAKGLGTTTDALARMTAIEQLDYVHKYFKPYKRRMLSFADVYMAILWPAGIGKPDSWVLWDASTRPTTYRQNAGLDLNRDKVITKREATSKVESELLIGMQAGNFG